MILNCGICTELITISNEVKVTKCGHLFHTDCILQWFDRGNDTCPHCRQYTSSDNLIQMYLTSVEEHDIHLNKNCPVQKLEDDLKLKESSLETLKIDLDNMCHENQESQLKLISMEDYNKKNLDKLNNEINELEFKLSSALIENDKKVNEIKEFKEKLNSVEQTLLSTHSQLDETEKKLFSANNEIERLKYIQDALILQNINNKLNDLNKCTICKELIEGLIENTKNSYPLNSQDNVAEERTKEQLTVNETENNKDSNVELEERNLIIPDSTS